LLKQQGYGNGQLAERNGGSSFGSSGIS